MTHDDERGAGDGGAVIPAGSTGSRCHWAVPALARLLVYPRGVVGDADYYRRPPLRFPERRMPDPPKDGSKAAAMEKWLRQCMCLRMYGSGN